MPPVSCGKKNALGDCRCRGILVWCNAPLLATLAAVAPGLAEDKVDAKIVAVGSLSASTLVTTEAFLGAAADGLAAGVYKKPEDIVETLERVQTTLLASTKNLLILQKKVPEGERKFITGICQALSLQEKQAAQLAAYSKSRDKSDLAKWKQLHDETEPLIKSLLGLEDSQLVVYHNVKDKLGNSLQSAFVKFSLSHPSDWKIDPKSGQDGDANFVSLESVAEEKGKTYLLEGLTLAPLSFPTDTTKESEQAQLKAALPAATTHAAKVYPKLKKGQEGPLKLGHYQGYGFDFTVPLEGSDQLFGRVVLLSPLATKQTHGLTALLVGTTLTEGIDKADDLGKKGELPLLLGSLHIAPPAAPPKKK